MNVRRLQIADYAVLRELQRFLDTLRAPPPPYEPARGDLAVDLAAGPPLDGDRVHPLARWRQVPHYVEAHWPKLPPDCAIASLNYYPPGGAGMGWHTDSSAPGHRVYIGKPLAGAPGHFLSHNGVHRVDTVDEDGIATAFTIGPLSWHAVRADGERLSVGMRVDAGGATARLLGIEP